MVGFTQEWYIEKAEIFMHKYYGVLEANENVKKLKSGFKSVDHLCERSLALNTENVIILERIIAGKETIILGDGCSAKNLIHYGMLHDFYDEERELGKYFAGWASVFELSGYPLYDKDDLNNISIGLNSLINTEVKKIK